MPQDVRASLRKPSFKRKEMPEKSWRDHPVVVAAITAAAVLTLMGGVIFPLLTAHLTNQLEEARKETEQKRSEISELRNGIARLDQTIINNKIALQTAEEEKKKTSEQLRRNLIENPFLLPTAYPRGLDSVRIGSSQADVETAFGSTAIDKDNEDYWSIETSHPIFSSATFYFDLKNDKVTHILYHLKYKGALTEEDLLPLVTQYFGKPLLSYEKNHLWKSVGFNGELANVENGLYLIYGRDVVPNWLSRAFDKCEAKPNHEKDLSSACKQLSKPSPNKRAPQDTR